MGIDARWEHLLLVLNGNGDIVDQWTQWDSLFKRPHSVYINPYDPDKHVWVVDDHNHAIFKFSNDGKRWWQAGVRGREVGRGGRQWLPEHSSPSLREFRHERDAPGWVDRSAESQPER